MANPNPRKEFLKPLNTRTKKAQRKIAQMGAAGFNKKQAEKKILSQIVAKKIDSESANIEDAISNIISKQNNETVQLLKFMGDITEGNKNVIMNPDGTNLKSEGIKVIFVDADPKKQINDEHKTTK